MILLCCKEMNTKKEKNKNKQATDRKGRTKLQLKGRIFMQNVTDTVCQSKPGNSIVHFWSGLSDKNQDSTLARSSGRVTQASSISQSNFRPKKRCENGPRLSMLNAECGKNLQMPLA
jgi:hypothetical protein